jgi:hypothetical protein
MTIFRTFTTTRQVSLPLHHWQNGWPPRLAFCTSLHMSHRPFLRGRVRFDHGYFVRCDPRRVQTSAMLEQSRTDTQLLLHNYEGITHPFGHNSGALNTLPLVAGSGAAGWNISRESRLVRVAVHFLHDYLTFWYREQQDSVNLSLWITVPTMALYPPLSM